MGPPPAGSCTSTQPPIPWPLSKPGPHRVLLIILSLLLHPVLCCLQQEANSPKERCAQAVRRAAASSKWQWACRWRFKQQQATCQAATPAASAAGRTAAAGRPPVQPPHGCSHSTGARFLAPPAHLPRLDHVLSDGLLADRLGQVEALEPNGITDVQRGKLAGQLCGAEHGRAGR